MESAAYLEEKANIRILNYTNVTFIVILVVYILNVLDIFIVDKALMNFAFFLTIPNTLIPLVLCKVYGMNKKWIKYMLLFFSIVEAGVMSCFLTYHAILISVLPTLYSSMYGKKNIIYYTFAANLVISTIAMYIGYFYGLCDANALLLTSGPMANYVVDGAPVFTVINDNPWLKVGLFFGLPRAISMFVIMRVCISISRSISNLSEHSISMKNAAETDSMTGLFNRNKYLEVLESGALSESRVAVIFFDINSLKFVNDTYGHEYGDILIRKISSIIIAVLDADSRAYRIGGDEIVVIMQNGTREAAEHTIALWQAKLHIEREITKLPLSAAVGFAVGDGKDLDALIKQADKLMYEDKCRIKAAAACEAENK